MTGDKEMKDRLAHVAGDKGMRKVARGAALEVGGEKLELAKDRAPEKTGRLKRSGIVKVLVSSKKEDIRISIIFGGALAPYARIVHETHKTHSKFLESVILEAANTALGEIAEKIDLRQAVA
jgi:hypothetical protein